MWLVIDVCDRDKCNSKVKVVKHTSDPSNGKLDFGFWMCKKCFLQFFAFYKLFVLM